MFLNQVRLTSVFQNYLSLPKCTLYVHSRHSGSCNQCRMLLPGSNICETIRWDHRTQILKALHYLPASYKPISCCWYRWKIPICLRKTQVLKGVSPAPWPYCGIPSSGKFGCPPHLFFSDVSCRHTCSSRHFRDGPELNLVPFWTILLLLLRCFHYCCKWCHFYWIVHSPVLLLKEGWYVTLIFQKNIIKSPLVFWPPMWHSSPAPKTMYMQCMILNLAKLGCF